MQAISEYIKQLTQFMIFSALVSIIAPSSSLRKYINLTLGIMLIGLIIEPVGNIIYSTGDSLALAYGKYENMISLAGVRNDELESENAAMIITEYKKQLEEQITSLLESRSTAEVLSALTVVNEDYRTDEFGSIYGIHVVLHIPYDDSQSTAASIAFGNQNAPPSPELLTETIVNDAKKCLMDFYNLEEANIHITTGSR